MSGLQNLGPSFTEFYREQKQQKSHKIVSIFGFSPLDLRKVTPI